MTETNALSPSQFLDFLLHAAPVRPVFVWGPPGIGKSALVEQFAASVGLECVSLLGSQLAPEDLIGVPQITPEGTSRFCPPSNIARKEPYCLFLDELNACSLDVQRAFYSLIHERRIGEYRLPAGSVVIGAGNRAQDMAIVKPLSSALINRMVHVHLKVHAGEWLDWASRSGLHPVVLDYLRLRPDHLWSAPPKTEEPFSTPRSWHLVSDILKEYGDPIPASALESVPAGCLTPAHSTQFRAFVKMQDQVGAVERLFHKDGRWPDKPEDRDILWFLAQGFRAKLIKELPVAEEDLSSDARLLVHRAIALLKSLAQLSPEMAQTAVVGEPGTPEFPAWFMVRILRDLPRLVGRG